MITITKPTYKCEYCSRLYQRKHFAIKHEDKCYKNPSNERICIDCKNLTPMEGMVYFRDGYGGEHKTEVGLAFCCSKIDSCIYPYSLEKLDVEIPDELYHEASDQTFDNKPMKKTCKYFDSDFLSAEIINRFYKGADPLLVDPLLVLLDD